MKSRLRDNQDAWCALTNEMPDEIIGLEQAWASEAKTVIFEKKPLLTLEAVNEISTNKTTGAAQEWG